MVCKVCNTTIAKAPPAAIASSQLRRAIQIYTLYGTMRFRFTMLLAVSIVSSHINGLSAYGPLSRYSSCARTSSLSASNVRVNKVKQMMSLRSSDQNNISEKGSRNQKQPTLTIAFAIMITALSVLWSPSSALSLPSSIPCLSSSTIAISAIAVSSEPERWDSIKFLEEQDGGRLAKVYYSPDGKSASGTDINGKRFIAQLQAEPTGPPIILVPLILLGIGALAFSKSSEGQAIKAASLQQQVFSGDGSSNLQPTKISATTFQEGKEEEDRSYEFESLMEDYNESTSVTPEYLLSCLLSGSYYLPPENLLRTQSTKGRRVQYQSYRKFEPKWIPIDNDQNEKIEETSSPFEFQYYADIPRLTFDATEGKERNSEEGTFRLFKFKLAKVEVEDLNRDLSQGVIAEAKESLGIAVSNAGGYHSTKDYFKKNNNNPAVKKITEIAQTAVQICEKLDYHQSMKNSEDNDNDNNNCLRSFDYDINQEESWVNINKDGHWNRLHSHGGAAWSGIYYIQSDRRTHLRDYSGRLLLKPTSHPLDSGYELNEIEKARLLSPLGYETKKEIKTNSQTYLPSLLSLNINICDYIEIVPEEGVMIIMPSWLQHAVIPLSIKKQYKRKEEGMRISLAFNFIEI